MLANGSCVEQFSPFCSSHMHIIMQKKATFVLQVFSEGRSIFMTGIMLLQSVPIIFKENAETEMSPSNDQGPEKLPSTHHTERTDDEPRSRTAAARWRHRCHTQQHGHIYFSIRQSGCTRGRPATQALLTESSTKKINKSDAGSTSQGPGPSRPGST